MFSLDDSRGEVPRAKIGFEGVHARDTTEGMILVYLAHGYNASNASGELPTVGVEICAAVCIAVVCDKTAVSDTG